MSTGIQIPSIGGGSGIEHAIASGTNTYTATISGVVAYTDGDAYLIRFTNGSDADSTLDINSLGAVTLVKQPGVQITGGDIIAGQEMLVIYDGTNFQCITAAPNQLFAYVTNDDSVTINKGEPVYAFGASGNRMSVKLAENTSDATSAQTVGVVYSTSIAPNQRGFVITQGVVSGLNTGMYSAGDQLYLGATAGALTNVKPYAPNHLVYIGIVERANAGNGQIYVKPQNGYELDELHDVDLITNPPTDGQVLTYDLATDLWKNEDLPAVIGENLNVNLSPVIDNTISDPSTIIDPNYDDSYLIPVGAIGVWAGQDNNIATWDGEQWLFYTPSAGDSTTVLTGPNAGYVYTFDGSVWNITITTSPGATPFYIAGSAVDAGGNKTSTIARVAALTLGSNSGTYGSSPLTVRGTGSLENVVTRWGMGAGNATTLNNWYRIAIFSVNLNTSKTYKLLFNVTSINGDWVSCELDIHIRKSGGTALGTCRVINHSGSGQVGASGTLYLSEANFEFRRYSSAALGPATYRLYYKPTILNSFVSTTVLNAVGGTTSAISIQWVNTYLGAAIEGPASGGSSSNFATYSYEGQRDNITAVIDPTVTDDNVSQYSFGSQWYNTLTGKVYQCVDNTTAAAVWKQITPYDGALDNILLSSSQWSRSGIPATSLAAGALANGFTFFTDALNKVALGTTSYNEYFIKFTRQFNLTGTTGSGFFTINGNNYPITFNTSLNQTALDFYTANATTIFSTESVQVGYSDSTTPGGFVAGVKFGDETTTILDAITFTNTAGTLNGTFVASIGDHLVVPYIGEPYENLRIHHLIRVNFQIAIGTFQTYELSLRRWFNNSQISASIQIARSDDTEGNQLTITSYTASALDPFVTGGFYVALYNGSTVAVTIQGTAGILLQNTFQKPVNF
jgi:hypothetical protein